MNKIISLNFLLFLLVSCEGKMILFVSDFKLDTQKEISLNEIVAKYKPTVNMDMVVPGSSKYCYGVALDYPVFFCHKNNFISVVSFYKYTNVDNPFDLNSFYHAEKTKYEKESYELHKKIVTDIKNKFLLDEINYLTNKEDIGKKISNFKD